MLCRCLTATATAKSTGETQCVLVRIWCPRRWTPSTSCDGHGSTNCRKAMAESAAMRLRQSLHVRGKSRIQQLVCSGVDPEGGPRSDGHSVQIRLVMTGGRPNSETHAILVLCSQLAHTDLYQIVVKKVQLLNNTYLSEQCRCKAVWPFVDSFNLAWVRPFCPANGNNPAQPGSQTRGG